MMVNGDGNVLAASESLLLHSLHWYHLLLCHLLLHFPSSSPSSALSMSIDVVIIAVILLLLFARQWQ
jgi:hypothetical protein